LQIVKLEKSFLLKVQVMIYKGLGVIKKIIDIVVIEKIFFKWYYV